MFFRFYKAIPLLLFLSACGVKGKPLPPEQPREIGIGKPIYKGVNQDLKKSEEKEDEEKKQ